MKLLRRKRFYAVALIVVLVLLFVKTSWLGEWMYPIKYRDEIEISAANYDVDPFFIAAIVRVESNYKKKHKSKKGAIGLMQLMPSTAKWILERADSGEYTMKSLERPDINIEVGAWYINSLYKQFNDNETAVIAAYNAGPGNVRRWLADKTWDGTYEHIGQIPFGETRHYIQRVVYYYNKYKGIYANK